MSYFIQRNQQQFGPYSLLDLQAYVAAGSVSPADQARDEHSTEWTTVGQLLGPASTPAPMAYPPAPPPHPFTPAPFGAGTNYVPLPPNLHWALVLLIGVFFSPFIIGWMIYQMVWVRNLDRESKALIYLLVGLGVPILIGIGGVAVMLASAHATGGDPTTSALVAGVGLFVLAYMVLVVMLQVAFFSLRRSMLDYYNSTEPIGLRLSGVMTFFFNVYYFQHHMSRIAAWKLTGYLAPQG